MSPQDKRAIVRVSTGREQEMSLLVNCECGRVIHAETQDEIVAKVEEHVAQDHPQLIGKLSREDIVAMTEEADA
jgi:predicted small metal-binding protein